MQRDLVLCLGNRGDPTDEHQFHRQRDQHRLSYTQSAQRPQPPAMTQTAQLLGISTDQLSTDLKSGSTLSSPANAAGMDPSDLLSQISSARTCPSSWAPQARSATAPRRPIR